MSNIIAKAMVLQISIDVKTYYTFCAVYFALIIPQNLVFHFYWKTRLVYYLYHFTPNALRG